MFKYLLKGKFVFTGSVIKGKFRTERVWRCSQKRINRWREAAHRRPAAQAKGNCRKRSGRSQVLVEQEKPSKEKGCIVLLVMQMYKLNLILPWTSYTKCSWCYPECSPFWPLGRRMELWVLFGFVWRNSFKR